MLTLHITLVSGVMQYKEIDVVLKIDYIYIFMDMDCYIITCSLNLYRLTYKYSLSSHVIQLRKILLKFVHCIIFQQLGILMLSFCLFLSEMICC